MLEHDDDDEDIDVYDGAIWGVLFMNVFTHKYDYQSMLTLPSLLHQFSRKEKILTCIKPKIFEVSYFCKHIWFA